MQDRKMMHKTLSEHKSAVKQVNFPPQAKEVQNWKSFFRLKNRQSIFFQHLQDNFWV